MKYILLTVFGVGAGIGSVFCFNEHPTVVSADSEATTSSGAAEKSVLEQPNLTDQHSSKLQVEVARPLGVTAPPNSRGPGQLDPAAIARIVDTLLSSQASINQKRSGWNQLREEGRMDEAIVQLQNRFGNNPNDAENAASLGQAYLMKCGTSTDVREQGILAMQADKLFDTALNLDSQNWEARFNKAVALSYWPASMGKSDEVIDQFTTLIQQQEAQSQQPEFADSYMWLGDQYKKAGRMDDALSVWQRGAYLFPENQKLAGRVNSVR